MEQEDRETATHTENLEQIFLQGSKMDILKLLQQQIINVKTVTHTGDTILHLILRNSNLLPSDAIAILDIFMLHGADPNIQNNKLETPLHLAVTKWNRQIVEYFLKRNAKLDQTNGQVSSVVSFFVKNMLERLTVGYPNLEILYSRKIPMEDEKRSADFVDWLLWKGFDFDCKNSFDGSALHLAIEYNLQHILPSLLRHTREIDFVIDCEKHTLLHLFVKAISADRNQLTEYSRFSRRNAHTFYFPKRMVPTDSFNRRYDIQIVSYLLRRGISVDRVDNQGLTALHLAVETPGNAMQMDIVEMLFANFTKVEDECGHSLFCALIKHTDNEHYFRMMTSLIGNGVDINNKDKDGFVPLHYAVKYNNVQAMSLLKENGAEFSVITDCGDNLLHVLAARETINPYEKHCQEKIFDLLVSEGCDVDAQNNRGQAPLHVAVENNNVTVIRKLVVARGVDFDRREQVNDWSPFHVAIAKQKHSMEVIELLLDNGANINCQSRWHGRPLHLAVRFNKRSALTLLLRRKAQVNARDPMGDTALAEALSLGLIPYAEELLAHGADINDECVVKLARGLMSGPALTRLLKHAVALVSANLPCSKEYQPFFEQVGERRYEKCLREVKKLKSTYIDSQTTLYRWLHMDPYRRILYCHHGKLRTLVDSSSLVNQFPQYSTVILGYYRESEARRALFESTKRVWFELTEIDLPDICLERIFVYLNIGYLFEFTEAGVKHNEKS